ncbi:PorP/SprF family type IX secretion system membrane protein [Chitinophaga lutea]
MRKYLQHISIICCLAAASPAAAQDLHFSQFFNSPLSTNPANTGFIPDGNYRLGINYRNQWASIPVPYKTMSAFGDFQLFRDRLTYGWVGIGGMVLRDVAGSGNLSSTKAYGSIAYHQLLGQSSLLSAGFNVGYADKRVDLTKLTFGSQWNGQFFDSQMTSGEPITAAATGYFDMQVGMNYAYFPNDLVYINGGFSVHHVNEPRETFYNGDNTIKRRYIGFLNASLKVTDDIIVNPGAYYARQSGASETMFGAYAAYNLANHGEQQVFGGVYYRMKDAYVALVGYQVGNFRLMFNYDVTSSELAASNSRQGAYELSLLYIGLYPNRSFSRATRHTICPSF